MMTLFLLSSLTFSKPAWNSLILTCYLPCSITDSELEPLRAQLAELDQSVVDQVDAIAMVKSNILRNDDKIKKMMGSVAFA